MTLLKNILKRSISAGHPEFVKQKDDTLNYTFDLNTFIEEIERGLSPKLRVTDLSTGEKSDHFARSIGYYSDSHWNWGHDILNGFKRGLLDDILSASEQQIFTSQNIEVPHHLHEGFPYLVAAILSNRKDLRLIAVTVPHSPSISMYYIVSLPMISAINYQLVRRIFILTKQCTDTDIFAIEIKND